MKQPGSNLVTRLGLILLAVLILVAAYFGFERLEAFLVLALILCLIAYLWAMFSLRKIEVEVDSEDCCAFPGQSLEVDARIKNSKLLPLIWLDMSFPTAHRSCLEPMPEDKTPVDDTEEYKPEDLRAAFLWVMPHQTIRWTQRAMAIHRGVCRVEKVALHSGDGFGLSAKTRVETLSAPFRFVVYPKIVPVDVTLILNNMSEMEPAKNGFYTDRTLLETTRDYREGDSFKNINWRILARRDEVQVNVYEKLTMHRVCFMPDLYSFTYMGEVEEGTQRVKKRLLDEEALERMFSLMASLIMGLHERGVLCSLVIPAYDDSPERIVIPESSDMQVLQLLTALAEIDYTVSEMELPMEQLLYERHKLGQLYVLSRDAESCVLSSGELDAGELGAITILQQSTPEDSFDRHIFTETDFITV